MANKKIQELSVKRFDGDTLDNCFYVDNPYQPVYRINMNEIFDWIKQKAITTGLTVELKGDNLMFIGGDKIK